MVIQTYIPIKKNLFCLRSSSEHFIELSESLVIIKFGRNYDSESDSGHVHSLEYFLVTANFTLL